MDLLPSIRVLGVELHAVREREAVDHIDAAIAQGEGGWVLTPNLDILRRLVLDGAFAELCREVTLRVADGMPLVWASRLSRTPLPERVAGSDLIWSLSERASMRGYRVFFLGGDPGTAQRASEHLCSRYPGLKSAGVECPPFGFERDEDYMRALDARLMACAPDVVFVALGSPKQEFLITHLRDVLPRAWYLGIGISFSFVCGDVQRAPTWMRRTGLEWVHRLIQEPGRLTRRYLIDGLPFAVRLLSASALQGLTGGGQTPQTPTAEAAPRYRKAG